MDFTQELTKLVNQLDSLGFYAIADAGDVLLKTAQRVPNIMPQLNMLVYNITQLNTRLKAVEDALKNTSNTSPATIPPEMLQIQHSITSMQDSLGQMQGNNSTMPAHIPLGNEYQVTIDSTL